MEKTRYKKHPWLKVLEDEFYENQCERHQEMPREYIPKKKFTDKTANGLTQAVIAFIRLRGMQAERISTTGRVVMSHAMKFVNGKMLDVQTPKYIPTSGVRGSADISATINGRSVKIEVKVGADRQREAQKSYQQSVENAGGIYLICHDFQDFVTFYKNNFGRLENYM